jgi:hypothetical protein
MFVGAFEFEEGGRSYRCCVEGERSSRTGAWWWFDVSGDAQRYAPFHPEPGDTQDSVRVRIVAFYNNLLARRAAPPEPRQFGRGRPPATETASADATADATADAADASDEPNS